MKFPKTRKGIALAASVAGVCVVLLLGGVYALLSGSANTPGRVEAGTMQIGLDRTRYVTYTLGAEGVMTETVDESSVDLSKEDAFLFDIKGAVPTSRYEATVAVSNRGDAGFDYRVYIDWMAADLDDAALVLADQLEITIAGAEREDSVTFRLSEAPTTGVELGSLFVGDTPETFTVTAVFVDCEDNNLAAGASVEFGVRVDAVQHTVQDAA